MPPDWTKRGKRATPQRGVRGTGCAEDRCEKVLGTVRRVRGVRTPHKVQGHRGALAGERQPASCSPGGARGMKDPLNGRFEGKDVFKNKGARVRSRGKGRGNSTAAPHAELSPHHSRTRLAPATTRRENLLLLKCSEQ